MASEVYDRGGNLYQPGTLQGNWYEDREQQTIGSNDGLRCGQMAYKEMMESQDVYRGPQQEISMPATEFKQVSTQMRSVNLFPCTRYKHPRQLPTSRVIADYGVSPAYRMTTTSMLLQHGEKRIYTGHPKRSIIDATNMRECLKPRPTSIPETGWGGLLPKYTHPATVEEFNKGTVEDNGAGFVYDPSMSFNPIPFPTRGVDGGDPWGRKKSDKKGLFGARHITSTSRMFIDARGFDMPRLGITVPNDTTMWAREQGMPKPQHRKCVIAYAPKDNQTRRNGTHVWDDFHGYEGHL